MVSVLIPLPQVYNHAMSSTPHIDDLEIKCAYLERTTQELSDVVHRQQQQLDQALVQIGNLRRQVEALEMLADSAATSVDPRAEVPPHY